MSADRLAEIKARAEAATPEDVPWLVKQVERLEAWKTEALPVMEGLQQLGDALGLRIGEQITGTAGLDAALALRARAESAEAEVSTLRAKVAAVEAHASRLAASLALTLYDAHPVYGSTALWHRGIGGQAITAHCAIINGGPPGMEWAEGCLPSMALREFIATTPGFDLDAAKAAMLADLRAALATTGEGQ